MKSIVIGSGFGGIAAALRLKAKNHKVTLIAMLDKRTFLKGTKIFIKKALPLTTSAKDFFNSSFIATAFFLGIHHF